MAATILTAPYAVQQNSVSTTQFDGRAASTTRPPIDESWDEQIVPALRKRLEEESLQLGKRISRYEADDFAVAAKRNTPRRREGRRTDFSNEIIQDGLGSDDLIPSEWVTGSSAQFHSFTPKTRVRYDEGLRRSASGPHYAPFSPTRSGWDEGLSSFPTESDDVILKAREKAKEAVHGKLQGSSPGLRGGGEPLDDAEAQEEIIDCISPSNGERDNAKSRAVSNLKSPVRIKDEVASSDLSPTYLRERSPSLRSQASMTETGNSPSRIPVSTSRKVQRGSPSKSVRKMNSVGPMLSSSGSPNDKDNEKTEGKLKASGKGQGKKQTYLGDGNKARFPSDHGVQDDFGPLGGSPRQRGIQEWRNGDNDGDGVSTRTLSNPWDEEMLPTIKRKLEQQRMLAELSQDNELVDTWDCNGMPMRKSPVAPRQRSRSDSMNKVPGQPSPTEHGDEAEFRGKRERLPVDRSPSVRQARRMQRLEDQLSAGRQEKKQQEEAIPMEERKETQSLKKTSLPPPRANTLPQEPLGDISNKREETSKEARHNSPRQENEAGCCSCTVM